MEERPTFDHAWDESKQRKVHRGPMVRLFECVEVALENDFNLLENDL